MKCPRCGQDILDPDPSFCPKCGYAIAGSDPASQPPPQPESLLPSPSSEQPPSSAQATAEGRTIGAKYYLLPLLAFVGGIIGYRAVKKHNPRVAATILTIGLFVSLVYIGAGYEAYSYVAGPSGGVYAMTITSVTFPNSTNVVVTVNNQGTLEDGLESVAINNGSLWLVYGFRLAPNNSQYSTELQSGHLTFALYGYILANGTQVTIGTGPVGTEGFPPSRVDVVTIPFMWTPVSTYKVFISTSSAHPNEISVVSPT
jgi:hypothetical protein